MMNVDVMAWVVINPLLGRDFPVVNPDVVNLRAVTAVWVRDYDHILFHASLDRDA